MAINPIQFLLADVATATSGSTTINIQGTTSLNTNASTVFSGSAVFIGGNQVVEGITGTAFDPSTGFSTITLRNPWPHPTVTSRMVVFNTIEGLANAIQRARESAASTAEIQTTFGDVLTSTSPTIDIAINGVTTQVTPYGYLESQTTQLMENVSSILRGVEVSPTMRLFKTNNAIDVLSGNLNSTRATTATREDYYGDIVTESANIKREQVNGWLTEGSSTNLALHSEDLTNAAYGSNDVTVTSDTNSYGDLSVDTLTTTSSSSFLFQSVAGIDADSEYTFSIYVRAISGVVSSGSVVMRVDGDVVNSNAINIGELMNSDGITRVWTTVTTNSSPSSILGVIGFIDTNVQIEVGGFQIEKSPVPTSYIPTTTTQVTRAADNITCDVYGNVPDLSNDFSVCLDVDLISLINTSETRRILDIRDGGFFIQYAFSTLSVGNSTTQITTQPNNPRFSICLVSESGVSSLYIDGVLISSASISYSTVKDGLVYFGQSFANTLHANCTINDFRMYNRALSLS